MTKNIYTILNYLAIAAIIAIGVDSFYRFFEAKLEQPYFEKTSEIQKTDKTKNKRSQRLKSYKVIDRRSIFGKIAQSDSGPGEDLPGPGDLPPTDLNNISLLGTAVINQENSIAIISVRGKRPPEDTYKIGDNVEGALIKNIYRNKVVLRVNGEDQVLVKEEEPVRTGNTTASPVPRTSAQQTSSPIPARTIPLQRDDIEEAASDLPKLLTQASFTPHFSDGEPDGIAITGVKTGSIFRKMGLRNGDIIKSVEGNEIKSVEDLTSLYDLQSEDNVSFQIIRRGRERTINLSIR